MEFNPEAIPATIILWGVISVIAFLSYKNSDSYPLYFLIAIIVGLLPITYLIISKKMES